MEVTGTAGNGDGITGNFRWAGLENDGGNYKVGQKVERRDNGQEWEIGYVTAVKPLMVTCKDDPATQAFCWDEVRHLVSPANNTATAFAVSPVALANPKTTTSSKVHPKVDERLRGVEEMLNGVVNDVGRLKQTMQGALGELQSVEEKEREMEHRQLEDEKGMETNAVAGENGNTVCKGPGCHNVLMPDAKFCRKCGTPAGGVKATSGGAGNKEANDRIFALEAKNKQLTADVEEHSQIIQRLNKASVNLSEFEKRFGEVDWMLNQIEKYGLGKDQKVQRKSTHGHGDSSPQKKGRPTSNSLDTDATAERDLEDDPDEEEQKDMSFLEVEIEFNNHEEYKYSSSTWDASLFLGTSIMGPGGSVATLFGLVMLVAALIVFCGCAVDDLANTELYNAGVQKQFKEWRMEMAHALHLADRVTGTSLVARVCNQDHSLLQGSIQYKAIGDITDYLPQGDGLMDVIFSGPTLCAVALGAWYLLLSKEAKQILQMARVIKQIPQGTTRICAASSGHGGVFTVHESRSLELISMTKRRKMWAWFIFAIRLVFVGMLCWTGTFLIVNTVKMADILLHVASLAIILSLDGLIYEGVVQQHTKIVITQLVPTPLANLPRRSGLDAQTCICVLFVIALQILSQLLFLPVFKGRLEDTKEILCGGKVDFVFDTDVTGLLWASETVSFGDGKHHAEDIQFTNMGKVVGKTAKNGLQATLDEGLAAFSGDVFGRTLADGDQLESVNRFFEFTRSKEYNQIPYYMARTGDPEGENNPALKLLQRLVGTENVTCKSVATIESNSSCYVMDYYDLPDFMAKTSSTIQALCPEGCGCKSFLRGTSFPLTGGCPSDSLEDNRIQKTLSALPCEDVKGPAPGEDMPTRKQEDQRWLAGQFLKAPDIAWRGLPDWKADGFCQKVREALPPHMLPALIAICPVRYDCNTSYAYPNVRKLCPHACWQNINATNYTSHFVNPVKEALFDESLKEEGGAHAASACDEDAAKKCTAVTCADLSKCISDASCCDFESVSPAGETATMKDTLALLCSLTPTETNSCA